MCVISFCGHYLSVFILLSVFICFMINYLFLIIIEKYSNEGLPIPPIKELYDTGHSIEMGVTERYVHVLI